MPPWFSALDHCEMSETSDGPFSPMPSARSAIATHRAATDCDAATSASPIDATKMDTGTRRRSPNHSHRAPDEPALDQREEDADVREHVRRWSRR